jgi:hypothetical protein
VTVDVVLLCSLRHSCYCAPLIFYLMKGKIDVAYMMLRRLEISVLGNRIQFKTERFL